MPLIARTKHLLLMWVLLMPVCWLQPAEAWQTHTSAQTSAAHNTIPAEAWQVLTYIRTHHAPMPGYVGGREFKNREHRLPQRNTQGKPIRYQEWDIHPHEATHNRGTDRIITSDDHRAWFTQDHYQTFTEMK